MLNTFAFAIGVYTTTPAIKTAY